MKAWLVRRLKEDYDIEVLEIEPFRGRDLWKATSLGRTWVLKAYHFPSPLILWLHHLSEQLKSKGFQYFPEIEVNHMGEAFFVINHRAYIVMPYLEGEKADYSRMDEINKVTQCLAAFHHSGSWINQKFHPPKYQSIEKKLKDRLFQFKKMALAIENKYEKDHFERQILQLEKDMIRFAEYALHHIDFTLLEKYQREAVENRMVSHRDVANHNFIIGKKTWMIDYDLSAYEPQFLDLWQLINRIMVERNWSMEDFHQIEKMYTLNRKLRSDEIRLLHQFSLFPNDFFREALGVYHYPKKFKREQSDKILFRYIHYFEAYKEFQSRIAKIV